MKQEALIKAKVKQLNNEFSAVVENYGKVAEDLIDNAAFMSVTLAGLQASIKENGTRIQYQHGATQSGWVANPDVGTYNTMSKNFMGIVKQLTELKDKLQPKEAGDGLDDFLQGK